MDGIESVFASKRTAETLPGLFRDDGNCSACGETLRGSATEIRVGKFVQEGAPGSDNFFIAATDKGHRTHKQTKIAVHFLDTARRVIVASLWAFVIWQTQPFLHLKEMVVAIFD